MNAGAAQAPLILVVDDDPGQRQLLEGFLSTQGFKIETAPGGAEALARLAKGGVGMVISDVRMPGMTGLEMLREIRPGNAHLPILLVTAYADIRDAVGAMRDGALNYLEKPIDLDELLISVRNALGLAPAAAPLSGPDAIEPPPGVIAASPAMRDVLREVALIAPTDSRMLITGESGVGKEVVADLVHALSRRVKGPIVKVNCAAIPETLLESELFGHERGSFTGAIAQRQGCFEQADGGTILLDEIGEMSPAVQAKLLRVTQDGSFRRVGGTRDLKSDVRILAATNRDLEAETATGRFREDLFYRLNVFEIRIPPLRERREDILPLAILFAESFSSGKPRFSAAAMTSMELYGWPGNVRELRNAMERAVLMSRGEVILAEHLPQRMRAADTQAASVAGVESTRIEDFERSLILQTLRENNYNRSETARRLGISRRTLIYKIQRLREQGFAIDAPAET